jgi:hypothetical protein
MLVCKFLIKSKHRIMKTLIKSIFIVLTLVALIPNVYSSEVDNVRAVETNDSIQSKQSEQVIVQDTSKVYTCSMHPEVISNKPDNCPKCGMELVVQTSVSNSHKHKMGMMGMMHGGNQHSHTYMDVCCRWCNDGYHDFMIFENTRL